MIKISGLQDIASNYRAIICDVWGVVHNGVHAHQQAAQALENFRAQGGYVVMLTNSPRPSSAVSTQMTQLGVPNSAYDDVVSSGDLTASYLRKHGFKTVFHVGPERDLLVFGLVDLQRCSNVDDAEVVVVTGLVDDRTESPEDYKSMLAQIKSRDLTILCANPDRHVKVGDRLLPCAGSVAELYENSGGKTVYLGKPFPFAYEEAHARLARLGFEGPNDKILVIGDGPQTDIMGANEQKLDSLYILSGLFVGDVAQDRLWTLAEEALSEHHVHASYALEHLTW